MFSLMANCFSWIKRRKEPIKNVTLLMVGLDNAGKTSTVADLKGDTLEGITPTVGFLSSSFSLYRFNVTIYDLGGGSRIRAIWRNYFSEVYGIVFVVDASDRQRLDECKDVLHESMNSDKVYGKPILILANKQDIEGALSEEEVYQELDISSFTTRNKCSCQVYSCTAVLGQGNKIDRQIKKGFQWLLQEISQNFASLSQRVERDYAEQKRIAAEERKIKLERIRREKEERERAEKEAAEKAARNEEDSDDVVVGKTSRQKDDTDRESPLPTKTKKKTKKKRRTENLPEDSTPPIVNSLSQETQQDDYENTEETVSNRISPRGRLAPLEHSSTDQDNKKKKRRKKKRKTNKTAPIDEDIELPQSKNSSLAWGESPAASSTMNGYSGRRLEPITRPVISDSRNIPSSDQEEDQVVLAPIRNKSWTRTRPNSDDHDIIT